MKFEDVLAKAEMEEKLDVSEVFKLLHPASDDERRLLFSAARHVREREFGSRMFIYGFVYFSTFCQNACSFCLYRHGNPHATRYRKSPQDVSDTAARLRDDGVHLIDLTMGEDPFYRSYEGFNSLLDVVNEVRNDLDMPVMISPGTLPKSEIRMLSRAGADWYACYQETHNTELFKQLRPGQDYQVRLYQKKWARECRMLCEEGVMIGVGEDSQDLLVSLAEMSRIGTQQNRVMSFVPQAGIPLDGPAHRDVDELTMIAVMRLIMPDRLIPASLDVEGLDGLKPRLDAGANVVTSIIPSGSGLAGVAQHELDIDSDKRSVDAVRQRLGGMGLSLASRSEYQNWIDDHRPSCAGES
ncbi:MAG: 3-methylornithine synthase [Methanomassiliicoccales archaeon PtaU1.Bin124]|nr:MAG: 3-methylornithine synthase [Methanomassiliicoccales archaeon PtaU1.Bin124]